ncbi:MAG: class II fructose-bisphosphate aldolase [Desulfobulbaceae bacterium]|nr:class II fructose-bisphosphate aldolase [Desulfobulbaceae bacterium]
MPVADYDIYCRMLESARDGKFAYPALNVTSLTGVNAVLRGLAESGSDGIIQVSTGGAAFVSGQALKDMALGAAAIAEYVHKAAAYYDIYVALHTDHCQPHVLDTFVVPLIVKTERRRAAGLPNLFTGHMFDGSTLPLSENLDIAVPLLDRCHRNKLILEIEVGAVGGEEDDLTGEDNAAKLYSTPDDLLEAARRLSEIREARFLVAATFGNVHGVYKPGHVKLRPSVLKDGQKALESKFGKEGRFLLVFHGGSGSSLEEIHEAIDYGVVKMNIDTDMQYAFTRPIADHMFKNYDGVLKVDGEVGRKKAYDPRSYLVMAENAMTERVRQVVRQLRAEGTTLFRS